MILLNRDLARALDQGGPTSITDALQVALKLEHATIPLYLYALYSLDEKKNGDIADIIRSVAIEEMLHITLVANVLNAMGINPRLDTPDAITKFPGSLPGGVAGTSFSLSPFTLDQLNAFLEIEQPETPIDIPVHLLSARLAEDSQGPLTIGQYYAQIIAKIQLLPNNDDFAKPSGFQITSMDGAIAVKDKDSAIQALKIITDQGEGTTTSPSEVTGGDWAHYYRYQQILKGRKLVVTPGQVPPFSYAGDPITFDPSGVYPVPINPNAATYTPAQLTANRAFNFAYTTLLSSLTKAFNTDPSALDGAIGSMFALKKLAKNMMSGANGQPVTGPTFEYQPTP
jgi:hypothetical protein